MVLFPVFMLFLCTSEMVLFCFTDLYILFQVINGVVLIQMVNVQECNKVAESFLCLHCVSVHAVL